MSFNLQGVRFGRLVVVSFNKTGDHGNIWNCICDCGNIKTARAAKLRSGEVQSCGCLREENRKLQCQKRIKHSLSKSRIYSIWHNMLRRCNNKNRPSFKMYGGRGITVCNSWLNFDNFYNDMYDGYMSNLTLERIDNNEGYCKINCKWATVKEQSNNRRNNILVTINGVQRTLTEYVNLFDCNFGTVYSRLKRGWGYEDAIMKPVLIKYKNKKYDI